MEINGRRIGTDAPTYVVAEIGANHCKSLDKLLRLVRLAKSSGADCVKTQCFAADSLTINSKKNYFTIPSGLWRGCSLYDLYREAEMPITWNQLAMQECRRIGIDFMSTAYDKIGADYLESIGVNLYKISSFEMTDLELIRHIAQKRKPIFISTGGATDFEISRAIDAISYYHSDIVLMKCSSAYPSKLEDMGLLQIEGLRDCFRVRAVGLSDHSTDDFSATLAVALGANCIEKHFCEYEDDPSPDVAFSMIPLSFEEMVRNIRRAEKALGRHNGELTPKQKDALLYRRSIFCVKPIKKGEAFTRENVRVIRPGHGLHPHQLQKLLTYVSSRDIEEGEPILENDMRITQGMRDIVLEEIGALC